MSTSAQLNGKVVFEDNDDYNAVDLRKLVSNSQYGQGVAAYPDLLPSVVSGLTMSFAPGTGFVRQPGDGTMYRCTQEGSSATIALDTNGSGSNPRIDQIVLHVYDASAAGDSSGQYLAAIEPITGTPTSGATLDNRSGAPDLQVALANSKAYILLADVLMPAGASTVSAGNVRDRRPFGLPGVVPPLNVGAVSDAAKDIVSFQPHPSLHMATRLIDGAFIASNQSACLWWLPRRIAATHLRWGYIQGGLSGDSSAATTSNWRIVICDASGRMIADTGSVSFTGADNAVIQVKQSLTLPYSGYAFDPGNYYVFFGVGGISSAHGCYYKGVTAGGTAAGGVGSYGPGNQPSTYNEFLWKSTGGVTFPSSNTIRGFDDVAGGVGAKSILLPVPLTALSIG